jgi:hypothetical protein
VRALFYVAAVAEYALIGTLQHRYIYTTSGFCPRVRAPVFLGSLPRQTGRCAPPRPSQLRCLLFEPQKYLQSIELWPPTSRAFFFIIIINNLLSKTIFLTITHILFISFYKCDYEEGHSRFSDDLFYRSISFRALPHQRRHYIRRSSPLRSHEK